MAEKDDRKNLETIRANDSVNFCLKPSSVHQDRVPSLGIAFARMIQSNDAISDIIFSFFFAHSISAS